MAGAVHSFPSEQEDISTVKTLATIGFSAAQIAGAQRAFVTPHDGDLVYMVNGTVPTATVGHIIKSEITAEITERVADLQLVAQTGTVNTTIELDTFTG